MWQCNNPFGKCYEGTREEKCDCSSVSSIKECSGYSICKGHKIMVLQISSNGLAKLLDTYYLDDIIYLSNKESRTEEVSYETVDSSAGVVAAIKTSFTVFDNIIATNLGSIILLVLITFALIYCKRDELRNSYERITIKNIWGKILK